MSSSSVTLRLCLSFCFLLFAGVSLPQAQAENITYPANSGVLNIKSAPYNAVGDGVSDDTAAFQVALTASANGNTIYIPNGTYRLTNTLSWPGDGGVNITLQGQSRSGTILRLPDSTSGFTSAGTPKVLLDGKGNHIPQRFGNSIRNLTVDTGVGNLGAIAVQYYANNVGTCRDVTIRGSGLVGLEMSHTRANGPNLVKNVTIDGFQYGIRTGYGVESLTFENITLLNQSLLGWLNENESRVANGTTQLAVGQVLSIRGLNASSLAVPAFKNPSGHVVMIDSTFAGTGAASTTHAIENGASGQMLLRNVSATGYQRILRDGGVNLTGTSITEWTSNAPVSLFTSTGATLNLPIQETPTVPDDDPATWANIKNYGATNWNAGEGGRFDDDAPAIQAAIDSGATTVFIPAGFYRVLSQINVRGNVRRIVGVGGVSSVGAGNNGSGVPYQGIVWNIQAGTHPTVVLENMGTGYAMDMTGVENVSSRTVVLRDVNIQCPKFTGPGDIFIENVVSSYWEFNGQRVWARQINPERDGTHIINRGATLWILGLKTEDFGYIIDASNGAKTEILGGLIYSLDDATTGPMIRNVESQISFSLCEYLGIYGKPYDILVEETAQGITNYLTRLNGTSVRYPAVWSQNNDGTTTSTSGVVGSQFALYSGPATISSLTVKANGNGIADNATATSLTNFTNFGDVQTGISLTRTYSVHNGGTSAVNFTGTPRIAITGVNAGDFTVTQDLPASLPAGSDATFQVTFTPTAFGNRAAVVSFPNTNTPDGTQNFAVAGNGAAPAPDIQFNTTGAAHSLFAGASGDAPFTLSNTGLGPLSVTPVVPTAYTFCTSDQLGGPAYDWIEIASGDNAGTRVTSIEGMDDAKSGSFDLGFNFPFHGSPFGKVRVHTNGYIELTNTTYTTNDYSPWGNAPLPDSSVPDNSLLPYWDDLYFVNSNAEASTFSKAYVKTIGTDTAVITFLNVSFFSERTKRMTFQIVLKRSGEIRYNYKFLDNDLGCTAGIQKNASSALQSLHNTSGTRIRSSFSLRFAPSATFNGNTWLGSPTPNPITVAATSSGALTLPFNASGLTPGESYFTQVRLNSNDPDETPAYLPVTLSVSTSLWPIITGGQSVSVYVNAPLSYQLQASGSPTSWALASGSLPAGVTLNSTTGLLSGTPTATGTFAPAFTATNAGGTSPAVTVPITITTPPTGTNYTFNASQADFEATFNETTGWGALWNATAGTGATGGLATDANDRAALLPAALVSFTTTGQSISLGVDFKARVTAGATNTAGGEGLRLGFNRVDTPLLASGGYLVAGLGESSTNSLTSALFLESRNNVPGTNSTTAPTALTLVDNEWYRLQTTIAFNGGDSFTLVSRLYGLGAAGTTSPVLLDTYTLTRTGLTSLVNVPVYVGFQAKTAAGTGGARTVDNFTAMLTPTVPVVTAGQSASGNVGTAFNYALLASENPTAFSLASGTLPPGLSLNTSTGALSGTPTQVGVFTPSFTAANAGGTSAAVAVTITINPPVPAITAAQTTSGIVGTAFNYTVLASNSPTAYALASGALPAGVTLNTSTGLLSGTPSQAGTFTPSFTATNAGGTSAAVPVTVIITANTFSGAYDFNQSQVGFESTFNETAGWGAFWNAASGIGGSGAVGTDANDRAALLPDAFISFTTTGQSITLGVAFKARVTAGTTNTAGGDGLRLGINRLDAPPLTSGGYLVAGLNRSATNSLTSALACDSRNNAPGTAATTDTTVLTLVENEWYQLQTTITFNGGDSFTLVTSLQSLGAAGTSNPVPLDTYTITRTGLSSLVNVPVYVGFQAKSAAGTGGVRAVDNFTATVTPLAPVITAAQSASGTVGSSFTYGVLASNTPTAYALASGALPAGVTLNPTTGALSGTPTESGTFTPALTATNAGGTSAAVTVTVTITPPAPVVTAAQSASGTVGTAFNYSVLASNTPTAFALASGTLPTGVTLNTATGALSGTPTESGVFTPAFTATNTGGTSAAVAITLTVVDPSTALENFRTAYGLASDGSQDTATPAGDGVANLLKYAFNMIGSGAGQAPTLATPNATILTPDGSAGLPYLSIGTGPDAGKLQLTFIRRKAVASPASGTTYAVEFSTDLGVSVPWAANPSASESATSLDATFERVTVTDSLVAPARRFVRVKVTTP